MKQIKEKTLCTKDYKIHDRAWTLLTGCPSADELDELEVGRDELGAVGGGPDGYRTQCTYEVSQMNFFRVGYSELSSTNEDGKGTADLGSKPASVGGGPDGDRTQCLGYMKV